MLIFDILNETTEGTISRSTLHQYFWAKSEGPYIFNRPGVAGAVLQTAL